MNPVRALIWRVLVGLDSATALGPPLKAPAIAPVFGAAIGPSFSPTLARLQCETRNDVGYIGLVRPISPSRPIFILSLRKRREKEKARRATCCA